ncbi:MAG: hypothetical protein LBO64_03305 [Desulfovibrio sp.]|jgi:hypothetical protein|nr:hypothetical protein [Desulfovibrio sp.]
MQIPNGANVPECNVIIRFDLEKVKLEDIDAIEEQFMKLGIIFETDRAFGTRGWRLFAKSLSGPMKVYFMGFK